MKLILITGGSASGKTTIAKLLSNKINSSTIISLDDYYYQKTDFLNQENINWDDPNSFNWKLLVKNIKLLFSNSEVKKEKFIYGLNIYGEEIIYKPNKYIILEGILSPYNEEILSMASEIIYLSSTNDKRYQRRKKRDMKLIKGLTEEKLLKNWNENVIPLHEKIIYKFKEKASLIIDTNDIEKKEQEILSEIYNKLVK